MMWQRWLGLKLTSPARAHHHAHAAYLYPVVPAESCGLLVANCFLSVFLLWSPFLVTVAWPRALFVLVAISRRFFLAPVQRQLLFVGEFLGLSLKISHKSLLMPNFQFVDACPAMLPTCDGSELIQSTDALSQSFLIQLWRMVCSYLDIHVCPFSCPLSILLYRDARTFGTRVECALPQSSMVPLFDIFPSLNKLISFQPIETSQMALPQPLGVVYCVVTRYDFRLSSICVVPSFSGSDYPLLAVYVSDMSLCIQCMPDVYVSDVSLCIECMSDFQTSVICVAPGFPGSDYPLLRVDVSECIQCMSLFHTDLRVPPLCVPVMSRLLLSGLPPRVGIAVLNTPSLKSCPPKFRPRFACFGPKSLSYFYIALARISSPLSACRRLDLMMRRHFMTRHDFLVLIRRSYRPLSWTGCCRLTCIEPLTVSHQWKLHCDGHNIPTEPALGLGLTVCAVHTSCLQQMRNICEQLEHCLSQLSPNCLPLVEVSDCNVLNFHSANTLVVEDLMYLLC